MKNLQLALAIFFICSHLNKSYSQAYTPFYLANAKWTMEKVYPVLGPGDGHAYWEIYTLDDTIINNKVYRKLATKNLCTKWPDMQGNLQFNPSINTNEFIFGGLREENKKVYFLRFDQAPQWMLLQNEINGFSRNEEHLLYDFNFIPGDTIHFSDLTFYTVINGDTTFNTKSYFTIFTDELAPIQNHRQYGIKNSSAFAFPWETGNLTEGIGSSYGLFGSYDSYLSYLICYKSDESPLSYNPSCAPCAGYVFTGIDEEIDDPDEEIGELKIYPNPAGSDFKIVNTNYLKIKEMKIYDSAGRLLLDNTYSSSYIYLNASSFHSGVIFLHIKFEDGSKQVKKVVIR